MSDRETLLALDAERFVELTTFRRNGDRVGTPVWIAREGDALVVTTTPGSGKVKRLRNDSRVELRPCSRRGKVEYGAPTVAATAQILSPAVPGAVAAIKGKYGLEYRVVMIVEKLMAGRRDRVILRLSA